MKEKKLQRLLDAVLDVEDLEAEVNSRLERSDQQAHDRSAARHLRLWRAAALVAAALFVLSTTMAISFLLRPEQPLGKDVAASETEWLHFVEDFEKEVSRAHRLYWNLTGSPREGADSGAERISEDRRRAVDDLLEIMNRTLSRVRGLAVQKAGAESVDDGGADQRTAPGNEPPAQGKPAPAPRSDSRADENAPEPSPEPPHGETGTTQQSLLLAAIEKSNMGQNCVDAGDRTGAKEWLGQALELFRKLPDIEHQAAADCRNALAELFRAEGLHTDAEPLYHEALALNRALHGNDHPETALVVNNLALLLHGRGEYDRAESLFRQALAVLQKSLGEEDLCVAACLENLGGLLHSRGKLEDAERLYREALRVRRKLAGDEDLDVARSLNNLATLLWSKGEYGGAEDLYRQALDLFHRKGIENDPDLLSVMGSLAVLLKTRGDIPGAEELSRKVLAVGRQCLGEEHPIVARVIGTLAVVLQTKGDYAGAEALFRRSLALLRERLGQEHPDVARGLHNLGTLLRARGDLPGAEALFRESLALLRDSLGKDHPNVTRIRDSLAELYRSAGDFSRSERTLTESLAAKEASPGSSSQEIGRSCHSLAVVRRLQGDLAGAERLFEKALDLYTRSVGGEHPDVARLYNDRALLLHTQGDDVRAEELYRAAIEMGTRLLGENNPNIFLATANLGNLYRAMGKIQMAERTLIEAAGLYESARLRASFSGLDRISFAARFSPMPALVACLAGQGKSLEAWNRLETHLARGLLDALSASRLKPLDSEERRREEYLLGRIQQQDERIGVLCRMPGGKSPVSEALRETCRAREKVLSELLEFHSDLAARKGVPAGEVFGLERIQKQLARDAAILVWVDVSDESTGRMAAGGHWACLIRKKGPPLWIELEGQDEALPGRVRSLLARGGHDRDDDRNESLRQLHAQRIAPVEPHLSGVGHLVVLPAGSMAAIPIEALTDRYTVSYAPSATVYAWLRQNRGSRAAGDDAAAGTRTLLAVGDPRFACQSPGASEMAGLALADRPSVDTGGEAGSRDGDLLLPARGTAPAPLPGSRREIESIVRLFERSSSQGEPPTVLLGPAASESALEELAGAKKLGPFRFLHFATHAEMDDRIPMQSALVLSRNRQQNDMERLAAGGEVYDGRLTADQIVRDWTLDADLVTLSACETALGRYSGGEGFLGFSQAFLVAGSRCLMLSLWKVDDRATALLMGRFYENVLGAYDGIRGCRAAGAPMPMTEALRESKSWLRQLSIADIRRAEAGRSCRAVEERGTPLARIRPYESPHFWAAFILVGDPQAR